MTPQQLQGSSNRVAPEPHEKPKRPAQLDDGPDSPSPQSYSRGAAADEAGDEDLAYYYIRTTHWVAQTRLSTRMAIKSVWKLLVYVKGAQATKEALKSFWTTLGVVSALLLSVSYSSAVNPLTTDDPDKKTAASVAIVMGGVSLVLSLLVIVVTVIYLIEIDNCTTDLDLQDFIRNNGSLFDILVGVFSASVVLLMAQALTSMYITYGATEFWIMIGFTGFFVCLAAAFAAVVAGHNRFRLWARYDSPLALKRAAAAAAAGKQAGKGQ